MNVWNRLIFFAVLLFGNSGFGWTLPVAGGYHISNHFWDCALKCYHLGVDIVPDRLPGNTDARDVPIYAVCSGTVAEVTYNDDPWKQNYGGRILIECEALEETLTVMYGHFGKVDESEPEQADVAVEVGEWVPEGTFLGVLGSFDENGGYIPHLHLGAHHGAYLGNIRECDRWTYAGYTFDDYVPSDPCYCDVLDNWIDPEELLGLKEKELRIISGSVSPLESTPGDTEYTWSLEASGGYGAPISASVLITNPETGIEYSFIMDYLAGTVNPFAFEYNGRVLNEGVYEYRFDLLTCADRVTEDVKRTGPVVNSSEPDDPPADDPPPDDPESECVPSSETCDGIDNDCDGRTDENTTINCWNECERGVQVCDLGRYLPCTSREPAEEVCDGRDNDCDGRIDQITRPCTSCSGNEGTQLCYMDFWQPCNAVGAQPEVCDNIDNDCDGRTDADIERACTTECGTIGSQGCFRGEWKWCHPIEDEICDGIDNDCDGRIDEDVSRTCRTACGRGVEVCDMGRFLPCSTAPSEEICDGIDNDCDGEIDGWDLEQACSPTVCGVFGETNGIRRCYDGAWEEKCHSSTGVGGDSCNGWDDDCDGLIDEDPVSRLCSPAPCGVGRQYCDGGAWGECVGIPQTERCRDYWDNDCDGSTDESPCTGSTPPPPPPPPTCVPTTETCDGTDNDCDGSIDESLTRSCSTACGSGTQLCDMGSYLPCTAPSPSTETCDGRDNDCDGSTDENGICVSPPPPPPPPTTCVPTSETCDGTDNDCDGSIDESLTRSCSTACGSGTQLCDMGSYLPCTAPSPSTETCDGRDNDCDGAVDENSVCSPPPPETAPATPYLISPDHEEVFQFPFGIGGYATLSWSSVPGAVRYEYEVSIMYESVVASGTTTGTSFTLSRPTSDFGKRFVWSIRAVSVGGLASPWAYPYVFYFSYLSGEVIRCVSASCPARNAWYLISPDLVLDYISAECADDRVTVDLAFEEMSGYTRSTRQGGCPSY